MPGPMSLLRSVEMVVVEERLRLYGVSRVRDDERFAEAVRSHTGKVCRLLVPRTDQRSSTWRSRCSPRPTSRPSWRAASRSSTVTSPRSTSFPGSDPASPRPGARRTGQPGAGRFSLRSRDRCCESEELTSTLGPAAMTYSIFDRTGNLVDAFNDRAAALDCLAGIAQPEPQSASEVFLTAQDDDGNTVGETVYASSVSVPA
jgi:hypothetical protein